MAACRHLWIDVRASRLPVNDAFEEPQKAGHLQWHSPYAGLMVPSRSSGLDGSSQLPFLVVNANTDDLIRLGTDGHPFNHQFNGCESHGSSWINAVPDANKVFAIAACKLDRTRLRGSDFLGDPEMCCVSFHVAVFIWPTSPAYVTSANPSAQHPAWTASQPQFLEMAEPHRAKAGW